MYLLNKIIQFRENSHPDHEKPFLEHLEDLRTMIYRIVITLVISMVVCFGFQKQLMEVLRRPVEQVWMTQLQSRLPQAEQQAPRPVNVETWEKAKTAERAAAGLEPAQRAWFYASLGDEDLVFHAKSAALLRAATTLPEDMREAFVAGLEVPDDLKTQVRALLVTGPSPEVDTRGNLKLMSALRPTETFMLSMKLSFFAGIILAFPLLLMFVLQFVLPGMHSNERRVLWPSMAIGFGLFLSGVSFAYYAVLPRALTFFYEWSGSLGVSNDWRIGEYISFATQFTLLFGLSFELPVVVMVFVKLGMLSYDTMSRTRSYAIVAILVAAAILTPTPDVFTLSLMALPMILLYEMCIWLAWLDRRRGNRRDQQEARERASHPPVFAAPADGLDVDLGVDPSLDPDLDHGIDPWGSDSSNSEYDESLRAHEAGDDGWNESAPITDFPFDTESPELPDLTPAEEQPPAEETPAEEKPAEETPTEEPPTEEPPAEEPPAEEPPAEEPPAEETPAEEPPAEQAPPKAKDDIDPP